VAPFLVTLLSQRIVPPRLSNHCSAKDGRKQNKMALSVLPKYISNVRARYVLYLSLVTPMCVVAADGSWLVCLAQGASKDSNNRVRWWYIWILLTDNSRQYVYSCSSVFNLTCLCALSKISFVFASVFRCLRWIARYLWWWSRKSVRMMLLRLLESLVNCLQSVLAEHTCSEAIPQVLFGCVSFHKLP